MGPEEDQRFDSQVCITIHSFRHRLADPDGISGKACVDGVVNNGILTNDTTEQISEVRTKQTKVGQSEPEKTVIIIEEVT